MSCWPGCSYVIVMESLQLWCVCSLSDLCASLARYLEMWNALICVHIREAAALMTIFEVCVHVLQENNSSECWTPKFIPRKAINMSLKCCCRSRTHTAFLYAGIPMHLWNKAILKFSKQGHQILNCSHACLTFTVLFTVISFGIFLLYPDKL